MNKITKGIREYDWIAIIGSREPTEQQEIEVIKLIEQLDPSTEAVISGCAEGIDKLALMTAQNLGIKTIGILPWPKYNMDIQTYCDYKVCLDELNPFTRDMAYSSVKRLHPAADKLSQGMVKLHARNYGIILFAAKVIAAPSSKPGGGGTGQGIRIAEELLLPLTIIKA